MRGLGWSTLGSVGWRVLTAAGSVMVARILSMTLALPASLCLLCALTMLLGAHDAVKSLAVQVFDPVMMKRARTTLTEVLGGVFEHLNKPETDSRIRS